MWLVFSVHAVLEPPGSLAHRCRLFLSLSYHLALLSGKYWCSVHRYSPRLGLSLLEAKRGDSEEAEAVSAMASLSVANTSTMDQR